MRIPTCRSPYIMFVVSALLAIAAAGLFALQMDDRENNGYEITRGPAFYIQVSCINIIIFIRYLHNVSHSAKLLHSSHNPEFKSICNWIDSLKY